MVKALLANVAALVLLAAPGFAGEIGVKVPGVQVQVGANPAAAQGEGARVLVQPGQTPGAGTLRIETLPGGVWAVRPFADAAVEEEPLRLGEYIIGVGCAAAPDALRAQLNLGEGEGVLVEEVAEDGPGGKAGIEKHDVLVKAGDKTLTGVQDLIDAVQEAKDTQLSIALIRAGQPKNVVVTPVKRESPDAANPAAEPSREALRKLIESLDQPGTEALRARVLELIEEQPAGQTLRWRFLGPGTILPREALGPGSLPENARFSITRQGDGPAKITVERGDQKWEVTEDTLDELPEDLRQGVQLMLGQAPTPTDGNVTRNFTAEVHPPPPAERPTNDRLEQRLERRLDELDQRIDQLRESIDQLRETRPRVRQTPVNPPENTPPDNADQA